MTSQTRNKRAPALLRLALTAAIVTASVARAADHPSKFVLTAFTNTAGGQSILAGNYDSAFTEIARKSGSSSDAAALQTNACVAYTMKGDFAAAHAACNIAVSEARSDMMRASTALVTDQAMYRESVAIAYSNRAVVDWLQNDPASAARDLAAAHTLFPQAEYVSKNLSALQGTHNNAVAQVNMAPKS